MEHGYHIIPFDAKKFDFASVVNELFNANGLENIHELPHDDYKELFKIGKDSSTIFHKFFYDKYRAGWPELEEMYMDFIGENISKYFTEDFLFQSFPTVRFHLPGNVAVGAFHKDADFNHPKGEVNLIIPLTNSDGTASVWVESEEGEGDFKPMKLRVGQLMNFRGNRLTHGNHVNTRFGKRFLQGQLAFAPSVLVRSTHSII